MEFRSTKLQRKGFCTAIDIVLTQKCCSNNPADIDKLVRKNYVSKYVCGARLSGYFPFLRLFYSLTSGEFGELIDSYLRLSFHWSSTSECQGVREWATGQDDGGTKQKMEKPRLKHLGV